jgi:AraC-like DNA-binding protein
VASGPGAALKFFGDEAVDAVRSERYLSHKQLAAQVIQLRLSGHSYDEIAQYLGLSKRRVQRIVERELSRSFREPTELLLQLELDRLDALQRAYWDAAIAGDGEAADRVLRIMDRRARYLGLDRQDTVQEDLGKAVLKLVTRLQELAGGEPVPSQPLPEPIDAQYRIVTEENSGCAADETTADAGTGAGAGTDG